jgi:hypothetical protein
MIVDIKDWCRKEPEYISRKKGNRHGQGNGMGSGYARGEQFFLGSSEELNFSDDELARYGGGYGIGDGDGDGIGNEYDRE